MLTTVVYRARLTTYGMIRDRLGQLEIPGGVIILIGIGLILWGLFEAASAGGKALFIGVGLIMVGGGEEVAAGGKFWKVTVPAGLVIVIIGLLFWAGVLS